MKKQRLSTLAAFLSAIAAFLFSLGWGTSHNADEIAVAAQLEAASTATSFADSHLIPPGETAPLDTGSPESTASYGWVIECADCPKYFVNMSDRSLRLDATGHPRIAFGGDHLYYAWHDGATWHAETVDDAPEVGSSASLALNGNGYPHISYYDLANADLKYAYRDASGWHIQNVDDEGDVGKYTSLALDGTGYPHISFYDLTNNDLKYAYRDASGWHIQIVYDEGDVGSDTSLELDDNGYAHISYYDQTNADIKYALH